MQRSPFLQIHDKSRAQSSEDPTHKGSRSPGMKMNTNMSTIRWWSKRNGPDWTPALRTIYMVGALIGALLIPAPAFSATNDLTSALQKGLFEEEANRNLDAAIAAYQSLVAQVDKDRQVAATAIFRLGECYRKLGKTNDAILQYERIVRDFADQQTLVTLSRQNLAGLGAGAARANAG